MLLYGEKTGRRGTYRVQGKEVDVAIMSNRRAGELWLDFKCINAWREYVCTSTRYAYTGCMFLEIPPPPHSLLVSVTPDEQSR